MDVCCIFHPNICTAIDWGGVFDARVGFIKMQLLALLLGCIALPYAGEVGVSLACVAGGGGQ